ncbi:MAG: trimethylamine methyltransferase family protein [Armatimonadota bacterium]|nr:trimethylamine methyltransferase family protein [Armatimonadota bacterium]
MFQRTILTDDHIEPLADAVLTVLEKVGVLCQNDELMQALDDAGAEVDYDTQRVRFPRQMTAEFVNAMRAEYVADGLTEVPMSLQPPGMPSVGTQVAQFYHDYRSGESRQSNREDLVTLIKFGDALHGEQGVGHALSLTDVPPMLEPLEAAILLAEYAHEPAGAFAWHVDQIPYLREMGEILGREEWFAWGAICFAHPLRFDRDTAAKYVARAKAGQPCGLTAMPVAGVSTPVTVEGFVVVSIAEHVATWIAGRAVNPDVPLHGSMWPGTVDMATGAVSYSAWDALFYGFAAVEFVRRWIGMQMPIGSGEYCDARVPGLYAALEKAYKTMTVAAFAGQPLSCGGGMVDEGKILSPVQILLDREFASGSTHLCREFDPSPENIAMDEILEVGVAMGTSHLETMHTARRFRDSLWLPELMDRSGYAGSEREEQILQKAADRVDELLESYEKPEGREEQLTAMREVVERARQELL